MIYCYVMEFWLAVAEEIKIDARTLLSHHPNYVTDAKLRQPELVLRIALPLP